MMNNYLPNHFDFFIGGFWGGSYKIKYTSDGKLEYQIMVEGYHLKNSKILSPSKKQWERFWTQMEKIDIWHWENDYESFADDGTQWHIVIDYDGKKIESSGNNRYPGERVVINPENKNSEVIDIWGLFLKSIRKLACDKNIG
jgi:hypothetical protein